jgi:hypothetical protein
MFSIAGGLPARVTFPETEAPPAAVAAAGAAAVVAPGAAAGAAVPVAAGALPASNEGASSFEPPHPTATGSARAASHQSLELSFMRILLKKPKFACEICHKARMLAQRIFAFKKIAGINA